MDRKQDPIQQVPTTQDLYDIVSWDNRTWIDTLAVHIYSWLQTGSRWVIIGLGLLILLGEFSIFGVATLQDPVLGAYILFSVVPAGLLVTYVWRLDITKHESIKTLVATFLLGFIFAGFAAVLESVLHPLVMAIPIFGTLLFFYLVVAPIEEAAKWLAIRLYAYPSEQFDAVIDGAVYGAAAGLGFATIENTTYIIRQFLRSTASSSIQMGVVTALHTAALRAFVGPGHVIYTAFAGYYLGLAKFNPDNRGPIIIKGLLIAALIHATYDSIVTYLHPILTILVGKSIVANWYGTIFVLFIICFDGVFFWLLYRKLVRYRNTYLELGATSLDPR